MSQVRLTVEEIQKLIECIQSGAEVLEDLKSQIKYIVEKYINNTEEK